VSAFPAFGSIKSFQDVKMALDRIRGWFMEATPSGNVNSGTTNVTDSHLVEYQGPTGKQIKDGGLSHSEVAAALAYIGSLGMAITYRDNVQPAEIDEANEKILHLMLRPRIDFSADIEELKDELSRLSGRPRENPTWEGRLSSLEGKTLQADTGATLTVADLGSAYVCDSGSSQTFNLPSVDSPEFGKEVSFYKIGAGTLTIDAADSDTIEDSAAGATVYCSDAGFASMTLKLVSTTEWIVKSATNTWITT